MADSALDTILEKYEEMDEIERTGPPLRNIRHEMFSVYMASGHSGPNAYRIAFGLPKDAPVGGRPQALLSRPEVERRIAQILHARTELVIARSVLLERNILDEYAWGIVRTREQEDFKAHRSYVADVARIMGMFVETEKKTKDAEKSMEELRQEIEMLQREAGFSPPTLPAEVGDESK